MVLLRVREMEKVLLVFLVLCVIVKASHKNHPKFPHYPEHTKLKNGKEEENCTATCVGVPD